MKVFVSFCYILFLTFGCYLLEAHSVLIRQKGSRSGRRGDGEKLGEVEGGETIIRTYCINKEYTFN